MSTLVKGKITGGIIISIAKFDVFCSKTTERPVCASTPENLQRETARYIGDVSPDQVKVSNIKRGVTDVKWEADTLHKYLFATYLCKSFPNRSLKPNKLVDEARRQTQRHRQQDGSHHPAQRAGLPRPGRHLFEPFHLLAQRIDGLQRRPDLVKLPAVNPLVKFVQPGLQPWDERIFGDGLRSFKPVVNPQQGPDKGGQAQQRNGRAGAERDGIAD